MASAKEMALTIARVERIRGLATEIAALTAEYSNRLINGKPTEGLRVQIISLATDLTTAVSEWDEHDTDAPRLV